MAKKSKAKRVQRAPLAAHPAFRVIVVAWLAAFLGLAVLVLTGQPISAGASAVLGGGLGWLVAQFAAKHSGKATIPSDTEVSHSVPGPQMQIESDRPAFMDVADLGLASLDAELPEVEGKAVIDTVKAEVETQAEAAEKVEPAKYEELAAPELGKKAAMVLKRQPIGQMSLVQMIERFALALDEHRTAAAQNGADRSAVTRLPSPALIEALRTLSVINPVPLRHYATDGNAALAVGTEEQAEETERALREALEKLQRMSCGD